MGIEDIKRGEKWTNKIRQLELQKLPKEIEWINSQKAIVDDIKEYENSLKTESTPKPKSKKE